MALLQYAPVERNGQRKMGEGAQGVAMSRWTAILLAVLRLVMLFAERWGREVAPQGALVPAFAARTYHW